MNNYCINCGSELGENKEFCQACGTKVYTERVDLEEIERNQRKESIYIILSLVVMFPLIFDFFGGFLGFKGFGISLTVAALLYIVGMAIIVTGYIKVNRGRKAGVFIGLYIALGIILFGPYVFFRLLCSFLGG